MFSDLLCFFLLFSIVKTECLNGSIPTFTDSTLCYFFQPIETYYLEAERECQNLGGHLTSVHNMFDNMFLAQQALLTFTDSANSDFWFGLNDIYSPQKWSWMDNTTVDFTDWDKGQPQNTSGNDCGAMGREHGKWISDDCFKKKPYVCLMKEKTNPTTVPLTTTTTIKPKICPEAWTYFDETGFCYRVLKNETWLNSGERCKNEQADLASIHLLTESKFVANLSFSVSDGGTQEPWNGLFTVDDGAHWSWTDRTPFDLPNWDAGEPNNPGVENCGAIRALGKFNNRVCSEFRKFVCKKLPS